MFDETEFNRQLEVNRRFYEENINEIKAKYAGQYVGIAFGKVVAADPDFFAVCQVIDRMIPQPRHQAVFLAEDAPAFEPVTCFYQGELLSWDASPAPALPADGMSSTLPLVPESKR